MVRTADSQCMVEVHSRHMGPKPLAKLKGDSGQYWGHTLAIRVWADSSGVAEPLMPVTESDRRTRSGRSRCPHPAQTPTMISIRVERVRRCSPSQNNRRPLGEKKTNRTIFVCLQTASITEQRRPYVPLHTPVVRRRRGTTRHLDCWWLAMLANYSG